MLAMLLKTGNGVLAVYTLERKKNDRQTQRKKIEEWKNKYI